MWGSTLEKLGKCQPHKERFECNCAINFSIFFICLLNYDAVAYRGEPARDERGLRHARVLVSLECKGQTDGREQRYSK